MDSTLSSKLERQIGYHVWGGRSNVPEIGIADRLALLATNSLVRQSDNTFRVPRECLLAFAPDVDISVAQADPGACHVSVWAHINGQSEAVAIETLPLAIHILEAKCCPMVEVKVRAAAQDVELVFTHLVKIFSRFEFAWGRRLEV